MTYDFMRTRVLTKAKKEDGLLVPEYYVVADFGEPFRGRCDLAFDLDLDEVLGTIAPLRQIPEEVEIIYQTPSNRRIDYSRAHRARTLLSKFDDLEKCSGSCIPREIAMHPKNRQAVATYMFAYQDKTREEIGEILDIKPETVKRYARRVRREL
jgi:hypothetical protein